MCFPFVLNFVPGFFLQNPKKSTINSFLCAFFYQQNFLLRMKLFFLTLYNLIFLFKQKAAHCLI